MKPGKADESEQAGSETRESKPAESKESEAEKKKSEPAEQDSGPSGIPRPPANNLSILRNRAAQAYGSYQK